MAAVTRQPFAPLDSARLQNLTSLKNRQNGMLHILAQSSPFVILPTRALDEILDI